MNTIANATQAVVANATETTPVSVMGTVQDAAGTLSSVVTNFATTHQDGIDALLIVGGVIVALCGRVILRPVVFLLGFSPTFALFAAIGLSIVTDTLKMTTRTFETIALGGAFILAVIVGMIMLKVLFRVAVFAICASMGGVLVLNLSLYFPTQATFELIRDTIAVIVAILTGMLSTYARETAVIFGTSFDGAALATYAVAGFLGHRPILFNIDEAPKQPHAWKVFYATFLMCLALFSVLMQLRLAAAEDSGTRAARLYETLKGENSRRDMMDIEGGGAGGQLLDTDPPKSPRFSNEDDSGFGTGGYGTMDNEYSVVSHLGAPPLGAPVLGAVDSSTPQQRMNVVP